MQISILTLFPDFIAAGLNFSILKRAQEKNKVKFNLVDIRKFATDKYKSVDDRPYGGGAGMVMRVDIINQAIKNAKCQMLNAKCKTILLDPQGKTFKQQKAHELSKLEHLILLCGHYEGVDERVRKLVDEEISVGDYILTGGELAALVLTDSVVRLIPGVLGKKESPLKETFTDNLLEYPQYTRPEKFGKLAVPKILLSGDHAKIDAWRLNMASKKTKLQRPDLLK